MLREKDVISSQMMIIVNPFPTSIRIVTLHFFAIKNLSLIWSRTSNFKLFHFYIRIILLNYFYKFKFLVYATHFNP